MNQTCIHCKTIMALVEDHTLILRLLKKDALTRADNGQTVSVIGEMINENRAILAMIKDTQNLSLAYLGD